MTRLAKADFLNLSVSERIELVEDIWDSIAEVPEAVLLTEEQKEELDRRLQEYRKDPTQCAPWNVVRETIRNRA